MRYTKYTESVLYKNTESIEVLKYCHYSKTISL